MPKKNEFELEVVSVRLVKEVPMMAEKKITTPEDAVALVGNYLCEMDREVVCVINLKNDNTPINCHIASIGVLNQAMIHPRELFKASILSNAASMIILHNHPSSKLQPSIEDTRLTDRMLKLTELMRIPLLDHIIVGGNNSEYFSFKAKGLLTKPSIPLATDYETLDFSAMDMVAEKEKCR
jgi:DNA repair protein RadC